MSGVEGTVLVVVIICSEVASFVCFFFVFCLWIVWGAGGCLFLGGLLGFDFYCFISSVEYTTAGFTTATCCYCHFVNRQYFACIKHR